jgi:hypothetical protein
MDTTTISAITLLFGAWSLHGRPVIAGTLMAAATIIVSSPLWLALLRNAV